MILKKLTLGIFALVLLSGCAQNAALFGSAYTFTSTGNIYQAGFTYGSNEMITSVTGKSTVQNIKDALKAKPEDNQFQKLVKTRIKETRKKLNISNQ